MKHDGMTIGVRCCGKIHKITVCKTGKIILHDHPKHNDAAATSATLAGITPRCFEIRRDIIKAIQKYGSRQALKPVDKRLREIVDTLRDNTHRNKSWRGHGKERAADVTPPQGQEAIIRRMLVEVVGRLHDAVRSDTFEGTRHNKVPLGHCSQQFFFPGLDGTDEDEDEDEDEDDEPTTPPTHASASSYGYITDRKPKGWRIWVKNKLNLDKTWQAYKLTRCTVVYREAADDKQNERRLLPVLEATTDNAPPGYAFGLAWRLVLPSKKHHGRIDPFLFALPTKKGDIGRFVTWLLPEDYQEDAAE